MTVLMRYTSGVISAGEQGYLNKDNGTKKKVFFFFVVQSHLALLNMKYM